MILGECWAGDSVGEWLCLLCEPDKENGSQRTCELTVLAVMAVLAVLAALAVLAVLAVMTALDVLAALAALDVLAALAALI